MKDLLLNVGSGGGAAAAAPAAGGAATAGGAAAADEPAEEEKKEEGKQDSNDARIQLTHSQKRKSQTRTWASVYSTRQHLSPFPPYVPIPAIEFHIHGALRWRTDHAAMRMRMW